MNDESWLVVQLWVGYLLLAKLVLVLPWPAIRSPFFALVNLVAAYRLYYLGKFENKAFVAYVALVIVYLLTLRWLAHFRPSWLSWCGWLPVLALVVFKAWPVQGIEFPIYWVGFSYMAFRLSAISIEIANGQARLPNLAEGLGFAFFLPTLVVGPISPLANHQSGLSQGNVTLSDLGWALFRILIGVVKLNFLGAIALQFTFGVLWMDGNQHGLGDFVISSVGYYFYIYLNFSGIIDVAIGCSALLGIPVLENFDRPFSARNLKQFWSRWHISLTRYAQIMVYDPASRFLLRRFPGRVHLVTAIVSFVVFVLIGVWHGNSWNYLLFGLYHALGIVWLTYFGKFLKDRFGRSLLQVLNHPLVTAISITLTFFYVSFGYFLFENDLTRIIMILDMLFSA
ncbi:MAG: hypothetical protein G8345_02045 [Magnetococcales bacterium]|nr:hypothetical protein [Magnetococcales bacterium]NGZ25651.1 hypothetical protein [Magnetococcales bacterium]